MAVPKDFITAGDSVAPPAATKIYALSFAPQGPEVNEQPKMISSEALVAVLVAMMMKLLENLHELTQKNSQDCQNQSNNGLLMARASKDEMSTMQKNLDDFIYARDHRSWWEKACSWLSDTKFLGISMGTFIVTVLSVAVTAASFGTAAAVVALAIGVISALGAFDSNSNGPLSFIARAIDSAAENMSKATGIPVNYCKFILKALVILAIAAAGGGASTVGVAGNATKMFVAKSMAIMLTLQLVATTGATYDLCLGIADSVDGKGNEETKKKWAMVAAMIANVVAMLASLKFAAPSTEGVNLEFISQSAQKAQAMQRILMPIISILNGLAQIFQAQVLREQADYTEKYTKSQKNMAILNGMGDLNSASVKSAQEELKSVLDEYVKIFADAANYTADSAMVAKVVGT
jgi:hypothetical protein